MFELNIPLTPNALRHRFLLLHLHASALWNEVGSSRQLPISIQGKGQAFRERRKTLGKEGPGPPLFTSV